jgi:hypothetical protein
VGELCKLDGILEECPSGRRSTPGKCVCAISASWVRIPPPPMNFRFTKIQRAESEPTVWFACGMRRDFRCSFQRAENPSPSATVRFESSSSVRKRESQQFGSRGDEKGYAMLSTASSISQAPRNREGAEEEESSKFTLEKP